MTRPQNALLFVALWLAGTALAVFFAMVHLDSALVGGEYIPRTNDSFYHARRILDAALGDRGFYEFDERLHVPDGTWVPWPWGFDYLVAKAVQLCLLFDSTIDPMRIIAYVPIVWLGVNTALFLAAMTALGLSPGLRAVGVLAFALSPLVQLLHAVGTIDHHFMELTFVLSTTWLGLRWFRDTSDSRYAAALGVCLGIATAFHNGLFILQLPVLFCAFVLWVRNAFALGRAAVVLGASLFGATLVSSLPSAALRSGLFEFALLSWFHVYVALCSVLVVAFMALRRFSLANLSLLAAMSAALGVPIFAQVLRGARFFSGDISILGEISEVASPFAMLVDPSWGVVSTASFYSWLLVAVPVLLAFFAWRIVRDTDGRSLFFAVYAVFGLSLLATQYRFSYFGLLPMLAAPLVLIDRTAQRFSWRVGLAVMFALGGLLLTYQPALRERLFIVYPPGGEADYASARSIYGVLAERCAEKPGLVLANNDDGNALLFHTDCSVIANNFIMRAEDERMIQAARDLLHSTPEAIRAYEPPITYVMLRTQDYSRVRDEFGVVDADEEIGVRLLADPEPPPGFKLLHTIGRIPMSPRDTGIYARLYEIESD